MDIQIVTVKWGNRYSANFVNSMAVEVMRHTAHSIRFVCITDDDPNAFDDTIVVQEIPDLGVPVADLEQGCLLKLAMFHPGVLATHIPTLFFDLDTAIMGDVAQLAQCMTKKDALYMLTSHWIQHWRCKRLRRLILPDLYYFGNSAILGFYPEHFQDLTASFAAGFLNLQWEKHSRRTRQAFGCDDRFVSYFVDKGDDRLRIFPSRLAVKFAMEYMHPLTGKYAFINNLPWVRNKRSQQVAVTFHGPHLKTNVLLGYKVGQFIRYKSYQGWWTEHCNIFHQYWQRVVDSHAAESE